MPRRDERLELLNARKRMLVLESDLNRARFASECEEIKERLFSIGEQTRTAGDMVSKFTMLMAGIKAIQTLRRGTGGKLAALGAIMKAVSVGASLWFAFKAGREAHKG